MNRAVAVFIFITLLGCSQYTLPQNDLKTRDPSRYCSFYGVLDCPQDTCELYRDCTDCSTTPQCIAKNKFTAEDQRRFELDAFYPLINHALRETDLVNYCRQFRLLEWCPADVCAVRPSYPHNDIQTCMTKEKARKIDAEINACTTTGGNIREFGNTCADDCKYERLDPFSYVCGDMMTWNCDCGQDKCWNGTACELN